MDDVEMPALRSVYLYRHDLRGRKIELTQREDSCQALNVGATDLDNDVDVVCEARFTV